MWRIQSDRSKKCSYVIREADARQWSAVILHRCWDEEMLYCYCQTRTTAMASGGCSRGGPVPGCTLLSAGQLVTSGTTHPAPSTPGSRGHRALGSARDVCRRPGAVTAGRVCGVAVGGSRWCGAETACWQTGDLRLAAVQ